MRSKNHKAITAHESEWLADVKSIDCSVCDATPPLPGGGHAHHIKQQRHYTAVGLCHDCHQGPHNGWHGRRHMWLIKHMDEIDALNVTIRRVLERRTGR